MIYTTYILVSQGIAGRIGPTLLSALVCTGAAVTLTAGSAPLGDLHLGEVDPAGWGWLAGIALVSTVAAVSLFFAGLKRVGPTTASILSTVEPVVTVVLAFLVFGELLGSLQLIGGALVVAAVIVLGSHRPREAAGGGGMSGPLEGKVALVAGATRGGGRGIAVALGEAGATVYATGRTTREQRSEIDRPETIEETAELVTAAGGEGIPVQVDHLDPAQVAALVERIDSEHGRLDVLVNDIWGSSTCSSSTPRCGSTTSTTACACSGSRSTRT